MASTDFIDSPAFYEKAADNRIYDEAPDIAKPDPRWYHPVMESDLSASRSRTVESAKQVVLNRAEEKVLFHQSNYAGFRVWKLQQDVWATDARQEPTPSRPTRSFVGTVCRGAGARADRRDEPGAGAGDGQAHAHERG